VSHLFLYSLSITQYVFLISQMISTLWWSNHQNKWRWYFSKPQPIVLWNKARPHTWGLEKQNPPMPPSSTIPSSMQYFIMIPISSGEWNAKIYNSQLVDIEDMKGMISIIRQTEILHCCKLYTNIEHNIVPTPNLELVLSLLQGMHQFLSSMVVEKKTLLMNHKEVNQ